MTAFSDETGRERVTADMLRAARRKAPKFWRDYDGSQQHMRGVIEAALSASPVAQEPVAIQSLEWAEDDDNGRPMHRARTDVGSVYTIYDDGFSTPPYRLQIHQLHLGSYHNVGTAKGAAQADYEQRIRSALVPVPTAAPAGLGADEIARIVDPGAKFTDIPDVIWSTRERQRRETAYAKANAILALLSRAGDQSNSTQKDGSR